MMKWMPSSQKRKTLALLGFSVCSGLIRSLSFNKPSDEFVWKTRGCLAAFKNIIGNKPFLKKICFQNKFSPKIIFKK